MNNTHDAGLRSWVNSANVPGVDFPIQNLPFGVFATHGDLRRAGVAIGDSVLDVGVCLREGLLADSDAARACTEPSLNRLMSLDAAEVSALRAELSALLTDGSARSGKAREARDRILVPMSTATMLLPAEIGDYTDFYASVNHATNVGSMFRPDNPLLPNYKHIPIGYHGRASSVVASGAAVRRPNGQTKPPEADSPKFGPSAMLDYESELGFFVGRGNELGLAIDIDEAPEHVFGFCLVNDWSARDMQAWEYQPLGPFLAKNFATTISPWVITREALEPYFVPVAARPKGDPEPLDYLRSESDMRNGALAAVLEVYLMTETMRTSGVSPALLSRAPFSSMYWTVAQMLTHHSSNGCNLRPGDLLASGTVSGEVAGSRGCLLELTSRGSSPVSLPGGEERRFLEDGDEVIMKAYCEAEGRPRLGFGECRGTILPAASIRGDGN